MAKGEGTPAYLVGSRMVNTPKYDNGTLPDRHKSVELKQRQAPLATPDESVFRVPFVLSVQPSKTWNLEFKAACEKSSVPIQVELRAHDRLVLVNCNKVHAATNVRALKLAVANTNEAYAAGWVPFDEDARLESTAALEKQTAASDFAKHLDAVLD